MEYLDMAQQIGKDILFILTHPEEQRVQIGYVCFCQQAQDLGRSTFLGYLHKLAFITGRNCLQDLVQFFCRRCIVPQLGIQLL